MSEAKEYKTKQRAIIERALIKIGGHVTADELMTELLDSGERVGRTTVYRSLERLVNEGKARKYVSSGEGCCYQYVSDIEGCREHFHLKCEKCGRLVHVECSRLESLSEHIFERHGFSVNPFKTVLYGLCDRCAEK